MTTLLENSLVQPQWSLDEARTDSLWTLIRSLDSVGDQEWAEQITRMRELFSAAAQEVGVEHFSYQIARCPIIGTTGVVSKTITTFPEDWQRQYIEQDYAGSDPVVAQALHNHQPFTWAELLSPDLSQDQRQFLTDARTSGLGECLTIPIHGQGEVALLSVVPFADRKDDVHRSSHLLYLMAYYLHQKARRPLVEVSLAVSSRRRSLLSPRETQVLEWTARGKSTCEIAAELGISDKGVEFHIEGAKRKLQASNRAHAVAKGLVLKLLFAVE